MGEGDEHLLLCQLLIVSYNFSVQRSFLIRVLMEQQWPEPGYSRWHCNMTVEWSSVHVVRIITERKKERSRKSKKSEIESKKKG